MADSLLEVLIEIDEAGSAMDYEWTADVSRVITVEVSQTVENMLVESAIENFTRKTAITLEARTIIWDLGCSLPRKETEMDILPLMVKYYVLLTSLERFCLCCKASFLCSWTLSTQEKPLMFKMILLF